MIRRKKTDFDDLLKRYLPVSSDKEIRSARDRFLVMLRERHELQEALDNFRLPNVGADNKYVSLGYVDQLVLTAIYLLRGEGTSLGIADKVNELVSRVSDTGAVFIALDRLERGRLIASRRIGAQKGGEDVKVVFAVTPDGERMLKEIRAAARQLADALADFA
jgi:hypothetical protein